VSGEGQDALAQAGIPVVIPSYRRGHKRSPTQTYLPFAKLIVAQAEADEYRASGNEIVICPNEAQGNLCRVRNWILDHWHDARGVLILDDDYSYIGKWNGRDFVAQTAEEIAEFIEQGFGMAEELGAYLWGINCTFDKGAYREFTPFSTTAYIGGPFQAVRPATDLRYDETLPLKEDYDFTLQHLERYRRVLRFNAYAYIVKQNEQAGGCATYRTMDRERAQFEGLQKKWGGGIVRRDAGGDKRMVRGAATVKGWDLNPRLEIPIPGV